MIEVGAPAPEFVGTSQSGAPLDLASFRGRSIVLYFYPKANTTGCTMEARGFAEHYPDLEKAGYAVIGVSVDTVESQRSFAEKCRLPFWLVADHDKAIAKRYGVLGLFGIAKRVTFFIGPDGRVEEVVQGMLPGPHVARAVARARGRSAASPP